jgi:hypothetical protein
MFLKLLVYLHFMGCALQNLWNLTWWEVWPLVGAWHSLNMLAIMIHGKAFRIITWKLPSRGLPLSATRNVRLCSWTMVRMQLKWEVTLPKKISRNKIFFKLLWHGTIWFKNISIPTLVNISWKNVRRIIFFGKST